MPGSIGDSVHVLLPSMCLDGFITEVRGSRHKVKYWSVQGFTYEKNLWYDPNQSVPWWTWHYPDHQRGVHGMTRQPLGDKTMAIVSLDGKKVYKKIENIDLPEPEEGDYV